MTSRTVSAHHLRLGVACLLIGVFGVAAFLVLAQSENPAKQSKISLPQNLFAAQIPEGPVISPAEAKKTAKVGDIVTITGRVGGNREPFVTDRAVLTIVGDALPACSDNPDDACKEPWDYCCETNEDIAAHSATVQVVDAKDRVLRTGLKGQNNIQELTELTIVGKVTHAAGTTLVIDATSIYVNPLIPKGFFAKEPPKDAADPAVIKTTAKIGDIIAVRGRIGGSKSPFVDGRAVFSVIGNGLKPCNANPADQCATPWDYCCDPKDRIITNSVTVQVLDAQGQILKTNLKGRHQLKELSEVVVTGKVTHIDGKALVLSAMSIVIEKP